MSLARDIHNCSERLDRAILKLENSSISKRNKEFIAEFNRACFIEGLSKQRRIKMIGMLRILAEDYLPDDFDKVSKRNLKDTFMKIDSHASYSPWTKRSYKVIAKKFYKWLVFGDEYKTHTDYPPIISWLTCTIKKSDRPRVKSSDLLTEDEIKRLITAAEHPRDKAFVSMLYELGARIGEIGGLYIKELTRDKYGYIIDLQGKTGHRTPRIVISDPYLTNWINAHPLKDKKDAPLWVMIGNRNKGKRMEYAAFRALLLRLVAKAGITRRVHPHLFRHTRVTHLLLNRQINEAQAKVYFGWVPESKMLSEYSHLISNDVNNAILELHGIKTQQSIEPVLKPRQCPRCEIINAADAHFCYKCGSILDVNTAVELDEERRKGDDVMAQLMKDSEVQKLLAKRIIDLGLKDKLLKGAT